MSAALSIPATANRPGLVAIVVTYDRLAQLQQTLARLLDSPAAHLAAVVVVDNASVDGTDAWLADQAAQEPRLDVLTLPRNSGGAGGFEAGLRHAHATYDADWYVLMDDDGRPQPGVLAAFHSADRSTADGWAAAVYHPDGRICDMNRPSINPFWHPAVLRRTVLGRGRDGFHMGPADYAADAPRDIDGTSFVGFFISRAGVARAGFPDGGLFLYGDDVLYTLGLRARGGRIVFDPQLRFDHDFSTMSEDDKRFRPLWKSYYHYRNLLMVYRLCAGALLFYPLVLPAAVGKWLLKARFHSGERVRFVGLVLRALRDGVLGRTAVDFATVKRWSGEG